MTARDSSGESVKRSRVQSQLSPSCSICLRNRAAGFFLPLPDFALECFAAQITVIDSLRGKLAHDDALRGNSRMVRARQIQCVVALHPPPAREDIDLRVVEHVADVQGPGYVWRRNNNRKYGSRRVHIGSEEFFLRPLFCPALFDQLRFVCFWDLSRHVPWPSVLDVYYTDAGAGGQIRIQKIKTERSCGQGRRIEARDLFLFDFSLDQSLNNGTQKFLGNDVNDLRAHLIEDSLNHSLHKRRIRHSGG